MIKTKDIRFQYNSSTKFNYPNFECGATEEMLITGPSGCGKSTLMHLLAGFLKPNEGEISINETPLIELKSSLLDKFRANNIGIIFQDNYFIQALNILENLVLAQILADNNKNISRIKNLASRLEIEDLLYKKPKNLSRGELQRASIVRSLINSPKVILADEPTSSLDDENCSKVIDLLSHLSTEYNAALIVVTHDSRLKAKFQKQLNL